MTDLPIKIKKLDPKAVIPQYAKEGDAGMDLTAISRKLTPKGFLEMGTGLAISIPDGYVGLIFPRSSISNKCMTLANSVGVVDAKFRGEITFRFKTSNGGKGAYEVGDRVGQLIVMPYPKVQFAEVEELDETDRGDGGFGSTDEAKKDSN